MQAAIQILNHFLSGAFVFPILAEAAVAIDRPGGDGGEEQQEHEILKRGDLFDQVILDAEQYVHAAEGDIGKTEKDKRRLPLK